jgi:subtilisin family serine protease
MMHHWRLSRPTSGIAGVVVAIAATMAWAGPATAASVSGSAPDATHGPTAAVTLVTGDRVLVRGSDLSIQPAKGREKVGFVRYSLRDDSYVVPADVMTLVAAGKVDRRLFDVTELVRHGYDDRSRPELPLIIVRAGTPSMASAWTHTATLTRDLPSVRAAAVRTGRRDAGKLWATLRGADGRPDTLATGIGRILLDGAVRSTLSESVPQIGAPVAWRAGQTAKGVKVAVLDTGIDATHPDLAGAIAESADFTGSPYGADDVNGHGTHVASIVTGSGAASAGRYAGVAPDATLLDGKVLDDGGSGTESGIIAGMEWAAGRGAKVINMSLGSDYNTDGTDLLSTAVDRLSAQTGALFVVAAGNNGPAAGTIGSPGAAEAALTVGAVDKQNVLAPFSARGPRYLNDGIKPEITAPGVEITAAYAKHGDSDGAYLTLSGTSMAAPHVTGAAAILAGQHPDWKFDRLKAVLIGTAVPSVGPSVYEQGAGRVDVARAVTQTVYSSTATVNHGVVRWPHSDDAPIVRPVTYENDGAAPVTLDLGIDVRDPAGNPAPAGMFTVDRQRLTVPPHGQATATLTTDTATTAPLGGYGGVLTARGAGGVSIRTPIGVNVEEERYNVTVNLRDRTGAPTDRYGLRFTNLDRMTEYLPYDPSGTVVARLPRGRYRFDSWIVTPGAVSIDPTQPFRFDDTSLGVEPEIHLDHDMTLDIDGRDSQPVSFAVDRTGAKAGAASVQFETDGSNGQVGFWWLGEGNTFDNVYIRRSNTAAPGRFAFTAEAKLAQPDGTGQFTNSPYLYNLRTVTDGHVPAGLVRRFADRDLATVHTTVAAPGSPGGWGDRDIVALSLPSTLTEYYTPGQDWTAEFRQYGDRPGLIDHWLFKEARRFSRGQQYAEVWNAAVFGPALPRRPGRSFMAERVLDQLSFGIPMFADRGLDDSGYLYDAVTSESTALYRSDVLVGRYPRAGTGYFVVPPDVASYRLHSELTQNGSALSTRINTDWTFSSGPAAGPEVQTLPLLAVRFAPRLDDSNRAPSGGPFTFGVAVQRNGVGAVRQGVNLLVQASYDDGVTWQQAVVSPSGDHWIAAVDHPAGPGYVSLRATASDGAGNSIEQTIIHGYATR